MMSSSTEKKTSTEEAKIFRKKVLDWYDVHQRELPWRYKRGESPDPYRVWLSEIMLQQTTVQAVIPYFLKFTQKWPNVFALADAKNEEVMSEWAGLGYYARARNLHKCAKVIANDFSGVFPADQKTLMQLPGIGDYTSAAIASIAFDLPANVVDGNIERVMSRLHACDIPLPEGKKLLKTYAGQYSHGEKERSGDYAQALMDLGATICTPKSPACSLCPVHDGCLAYRNDNPQEYPVKKPKQDRPKRYGYVYWVTNDLDEILLHRRQEKGLLGGMIGLPTTEWQENRADLQHSDLFSGFDLCEVSEHVKHVFTHFELKLIPYKISVQGSSLNLCDDYFWVKAKDFSDYGLPTVFSKAVKFFV